MKGRPWHALTASDMPARRSVKPPIPRLPAVIATRSPALTFCPTPKSTSFCLTSFRTSSMWSAGRHCCTRAIRGSACRGNDITALDDFTNLILQDRLDDVPALFLSPDECFGEVQGLFRADLARHGGLIRIHHRLHDRRATVFQRLAKHRCGLLRAIDGESSRATVHRHAGKIDGLQIHAELWIAFENHLLPLDFA